MKKTKDLSAFELGMVVRARHNGLSGSRTAKVGATQYWEGVPNVLYTQCRLLMNSHKWAVKTAR